MAVIEAEQCNIISSYFIQLRNNFYNTLSTQNIKLIKEIHSMGHNIGLHVHLGGLNEIKDIENYILKDIDILRYYTNINIDRFSFHRPTKDVLKLNLNIGLLVNVYSDKYFHFIDNNEQLDFLKIKYISDSMHRWNYGYPNEKMLVDNDRIQLLIHPYSWTEEGLSNQDNFRSLIKEKNRDLINTIRSECNHFDLEEEIYGV